MTAKICLNLWASYNKAASLQETALFHRLTGPVLKPDPDITSPHREEHRIRPHSQLMGPDIPQDQILTRSPLASSSVSWKRWAYVKPSGLMGTLPQKITEICSERNAQVAFLPRWRELCDYLFCSQEVLDSKWIHLTLQRLCVYVWMYVLCLCVQAQAQIWFWKHHIYLRMHVLSIRCI